MISEEKDRSGYFRAKLAVPSEKYPRPILLEEEWLRTNMPLSPSDSNKGTFGRAILLAGSNLYPGAALLAAKGCLAGGCGILTVYSAEAARSYFANLPEVIFRIMDGSSSPDTFASADAVGMGPGWGDSTNASAAFNVLKTAKKILIDADGLNLLSKNAELKAMLSERAVVTPHPGEMSRLTGIPIKEITADPIRVAYAFAQEHGCTVLLKGTCTVIADPDKIRITASGNNGLAKGGSGDVLSGLITAMMCRGKEPFEAACLGSLLLGTGAQKAFEILRERLLRASDISDAIIKEIL